MSIPVSTITDRKHNPPTKMQIIVVRQGAEYKVICKKCKWAPIAKHPTSGGAKEACAAHSC